MSEESIPVKDPNVEKIETDPTVLLFSKRMDLSEDKVDSQNTLLPQLSLHSLYSPTLKTPETSSQIDTTYICSAQDTKNLTPSDFKPAHSPALYEIKQEIARGGMGIIFKGYQVVLKREIAIKSITSRLLTPRQRESFIEESQITAYLDHPNIVPVYDLGENESGETILVMKLIKGKS